MLHETFWNFINAMMRNHYYNYIGKVWNESENVYKSYRIFNVSTYFTELRSYLNGKFGQYYHVSFISLQWSYYSYTFLVHSLAAQFIKHLYINKKFLLLHEMQRKLKDKFAEGFLHVEETVCRITLILEDKMSD